MHQQFALLRAERQVLKREARQLSWRASLLSTMAVGSTTCMFGYRLLTHHEALDQGSMNLKFSATLPYYFSSELTLSNLPAKPAQYCFHHSGELLSRPGTGAAELAQDI